ncbi:MAG: cupredoxin domain-containing protein [Acidobacteria bacterium]|nr:cupredoxin domain-containing protein [Acidobacteriota bacterium]
MSILGRQVPVTAIAALAAAMILAALIPALSSTPSREITLVAKDMAFYLAGDPRTANPTLEVKAGERVRIVLRNQDRGMTHDVAVPAAAAALDPIRWNESSDVVFEAPGTPGTYEYICRSHRLMMRGTIRVD